MLNVAWLVYVVVGELDFYDLEHCFYSPFKTCCAAVIQFCLKFSDTELIGYMIIFIHFLRFGWFAMLVTTSKSVLSFLGLPWCSQKLLSEFVHSFL